VNRAVPSAKSQRWRYGPQSKGGGEEKRQREQTPGWQSLLKNLLRRLELPELRLFGVHCVICPTHHCVLILGIKEKSKGEREREYRELAPPQLAAFPLDSLSVQLQIEIPFFPPRRFTCVLTSMGGIKGALECRQPKRTPHLPGSLVGGPRS